MIKALNRLGDRMVGRFVPRATADADHCWVESCCTAKWCRDCCRNGIGGTECRGWYYC